VLIYDVWNARVRYFAEQAGIANSKREFLHHHIEMEIRREQA